MSTEMSHEGRLRSATPTAMSRARNKHRDADGVAPRSCPPTSRALHGWPPDAKSGARLSFMSSLWSLAMSLLAWGGESARAGTKM